MPLVHAEPVEVAETVVAVLSTKVVGPYVFVVLAVPVECSHRMVVQQKQFISRRRWLYVILGIRGS